MQKEEMQPKTKTLNIPLRNYESEKDKISARIEKEENKNKIFSMTEGPNVNENHGLKAKYTAIEEVILINKENDNLKKYLLELKKERLKNKHVLKRTKLVKSPSCGTRRSNFFSLNEFQSIKAHYSLSLFLFLFLSSLLKEFN